MKDLFAICAIMVYNIAILAGTAYLVQVYDWNPWWFLLTVGLMLSTKRVEDKDEPSCKSNNIN